jgi:hypothetical protein
MDNVPEVIVDDVLTVKAAVADDIEAVEAFQRVISYYASLRHLDDERRRAIEQNLARYVNQQLETAMKPVETAVQNMWNHSDLLATEKTVKEAGHAIAGAIVETLKQVQDQLTLMSSRTEGVAYALDEIEDRLGGMGAKIKRKKAKPVTILGRMVGSKEEDKKDDDDSDRQK